MSKEAMIPFGYALEAYYKGKEDAKVVYHRDDGQSTEDYIKGYFRSYSSFPEREKVAIKSCKGKILDIGAGAGRHSLELQKRGYNVLAIDICDKACEIMKFRGVKNVKCSPYFELKVDKFDTLLLMGCSIAFVENLNGIKKFLEYAKTLLNPNGIILMDSRDVKVTDNPKHIEYQKKNVKLGKYPGEITISIEYNGKLGKEFQILHIDPDTLKETAEKAGWNCKILYVSEDGLYLAKLSKD